MLRFRRHDPVLGCTVTGVYGYRAECPCGFSGGRWPLIGIARAELRAHRRDEHER